MALKTSLRLIGRRIYGAIKRAAARQGLTPDDFAVSGSFDEQSESISLTIGTDRPVNDLDWYREILQEIRDALPEAPHLALSVGIVIHKVENLDEVYWDSRIADDEIDFTDYLNDAPQA